MSPLIWMGAAGGQKATVWLAHLAPVGIRRRDVGEGCCVERGARWFDRDDAERAMISAPPGVKIVVAAEPIDFRKGLDGLAAIVQRTLRADPFAGDVFIFRCRRADRLKI
jgi:hypothetical protein